MVISLTRRAFLQGILFFLIISFYAQAYAGLPSCCTSFFDSSGFATKVLSDFLNVTDVEITGDKKIYSVCENENVKSWRTHPGVERWDLKLNDDLKGKVGAIISFCENKFSMNGKVFPEKNIVYSGVLFLGASFSRVIDRVKFYKELLRDGLIDRDLKLWVLSGDRMLSKKIGETAEAFLKLVPEGEKPSLLPENESDMIKFVFYYIMPKFIDVEYVYSKKDPGYIRATTAGTVYAWVDNIPKSSNKVYYLAVSNQPYVKYQESVINLVLRNICREDVEVHVVGNEDALHYDLDNYAAILLDTVAKIIWNCNEMFDLCCVKI